MACCAHRRGGRPPRRAPGGHSPRYSAPKKHFKLAFLPDTFREPKRIPCDFQVGWFKMTGTVVKGTILLV